MLTGEKVEEYIKSYGIVHVDLHSLFLTDTYKIIIFSNSTAVGKHVISVWRRTMLRDPKNATECGNKDVKTNYKSH